MDKIQWTKDYETGIDRIDFQHRSLVNILNDLISVPNLEASQRHLVLDVTMDALLKYTVYHFESEEKFMKDANYPKIVEHIKEHEALKKTAIEFVSRFQKGERDIEKQIIQFLRNWLLNHIGKSDMDYVPYVMKIQDAQGF